MKILITGGLGYIGSHICVELLDKNYEVVVVDDLSNSKLETKNAIEKITNKKINAYIFNIVDEKKLTKLFKKEKNIQAVIHCAGYKAVGESVEKPLMYYDNNINTTLTLLKVMKNFNCNNLIFSSSATVYGVAKKMPLTEDSTIGVTNPYGRTKLMIEEILTDYAHSNKNFKAILLRYFNPIGAHESGLIGENPNGIPNNLLPYISRVACGKLKELSIFGNDYKTHDGTGVRDYIHVVDLAKGHLKSIEYLPKMKENIEVFNLGTGTGYSVLDVVNAYNKVCNDKVKYKFAPRRSGDIAECYCSPEKANKILGWKATLTLDDMCKSSYKYENQNK